MRTKNDTLNYYQNGCAKTEKQTDRFTTVLNFYRHRETEAKPPLQKAFFFVILKEYFVIAVVIAIKSITGERLILTWLQR